MNKTVSVEHGEITGFHNPDSKRSHTIHENTPTDSVFKADFPSNDKNTKSNNLSNNLNVEQEIENSKSPNERTNVFKKYEKNEVFPIHVNLDDS